MTTHEYVKLIIDSTNGYAKKYDDYVKLIKTEYSH